MNGIIKLTDRVKKLESVVDQLLAFQLCEIEDGEVVRSNTMTEHPVRSASVANQIKNYTKG
jgi:hypothetical protein